MFITKEDLLQFPRFFNHESARMWLKERYGSYFVMSDINYDPFGKKIYYYSLVQDKDRYLEWRDKLARSEVVDDSLYEDTHQKCSITEDGKFTVDLG